MHTCAIATNGEGYCWGTGGSLGDGTSTRSHTPRLVAGGHTFTGISVNWYGTCGTTQAGDVYCWGDARWGRLGQEVVPETSALSPVRVASSERFIQVATGGLHACAITEDGSALCWGRNDDDQLGAITSELCDGYACSIVPIAVSGGHHFRSLDAGWTHTCGVTVGDEVYCWGHNGAGNLGVSELLRSGTPVRAAGSLLFTSVSAGMNQTCGVTTTGAGVCWGGNWEGQFGNGTPGYQNPNPENVAGGLHFASLTTNYQHSCGVTTDGRAFCWGANHEGQLGNGGESTHICGLNNTPCVPAPVRVAEPD
jgi:hypothetical protein